MSVLFVCLGNICRSPIAEAVFANLAEGAGADIEIDSAGTGSWHIGEEADPRARRAAEQNGYSITHLARQLESQDFERFDHIVVMDSDNMREVMAWPGARKEKVTYLLQWDPDNDDLEVPDPYTGDEEDFERVLEMCYPACQNLLSAIVNSRRMFE